MKMEKAITAPLTKDAIRGLRVGDEVLLSGSIYTARDAAHKRFQLLLEKGRPLPINLKGEVIYYAGPTPARPGKKVGSCGPTTSARMDEYTPELIRLGLAGMIGKGLRSQSVREAIRRYGAIYFLATGGLGALLSTKVTSARVILYKDLGPEAIFRLQVENFPLTVGIDTKGRDIYDSAGW